MLVICEECAKKYHVDANKIKGARAKFTCKVCGHVIVVEKPEPEPAKAVPVSGTEPSAPDAPKTGGKAEPEKAAPQAAVPALAKGRGKPFVFYLLIAAAVGLLLTGGAFILLYFKYVPKLVQSEMELRSLAVAASLRQTVSKPLQRKDYLVVNQEAKRVAKLPGIAYAAVVDEKGAVVAGVFNSMSSFDSQFVRQVNEKGFPVEVLALNGLKAGAKEGSVRISMGGQPVHDRVLALAATDGEVHVGLFAAEAESAVWDTLLSPLLFAPFAIALLFIFLLTVLVNGLIARPARSLTGTANRISLGELDLAIAAEGSRELRDLSMALERMRHSVRIAVERLNKPPR
jgi:predicted Zn finger-like uncharacterized protein